MILQALVEHYEDLIARGEIARPGWGPAKVSYVIELDDDGTILNVISLKEPVERGKKTVSVPRIMDVPAPVIRSSGVKSNFLCDNSSYILGSDNKGKPERTMECFRACRTLHHELLDESDHPAAAAVLHFFDSWNPLEAKEYKEFKAYGDEIFTTANFIFEYDGEFVHEIDEIREIWQSYFDASESVEKGVCLVTGKNAPIAQLHPMIKGVNGAQMAGASLVSFNGPAFCSYGHDQGENAPTSEYAAFAYGAALNHLVADKEHLNYIGDTALLCWAKGGDTTYSNTFGCMLFGEREDEAKYTESDYWTAAFDLARGVPHEFEKSRLDPECPFYVLGLAPNAARLSVRFFIKDSFGHIMGNIIKHQERLKIEKPQYDNRDVLPVKSLLFETINKNSKDKTASPQLAGDLLRAILNDARYPATLINGVTLRIRAEHSVTRGRAAIIKAYYSKNKNKDVPEEVLRMSLNPQCENVAYNLGRLFAVLESIQGAAYSSSSPIKTEKNGENQGAGSRLNATIKDKYFNSASATPATVFPVLIKLAQNHLKVLDREKTGLRINFDIQLDEIMGLLGEYYPKRLTLPQQGSFQLGYYHQRQENFKKSVKEEK